MSYDTFIKKIFFNFPNRNIRYSPINRDKGKNFIYLQEGIPFVFLLLSVQFCLYRSKICSMTLEPIKEGD